MIDLKKRSYQKELLDSDAIPFNDIKQNMIELNTVNTLLGGHTITITGLRKLLGNKKKITICEIGCGGGDNLMAIHKWCLKNNITAVFIGIDINENCIQYAKEKIKNKNFNWVVSDYKKVNFTNKPDIIFSSLFCHHFTEVVLSDIINWKKTNSNIGFFINDLQRNIIAYYAIKVITQIFSKSYLVKNDAPLSVARGFHKKEWLNILSDYENKLYQIKWKWAFRFLIIYTHE